MEKDLNKEVILTIKVQVLGDYTEDDLKKYLLFCMGFGSLPNNNPFIDEYSNSEISDIDFL